jgi:hypothetical protein
MVVVLSGLKVATLVNVLNPKTPRSELSNVLKLHAVMLAPILLVVNSDMLPLPLEKLVLVAILVLVSVTHLLVTNQLFLNLLESLVKVKDMNLNGLVTVNAAQNQFALVNQFFALHQLAPTNASTVSNSSKSTLKLLAAQNTKKKLAVVNTTEISTLQAPQ